MASKTEALKRRVTKRITTPPSIIKALIIVVAGVTLIVFQFADHFEKHYGVYKFLEAGLISSCLTCIIFLVAGLVAPFPCISDETLWLVESFIHVVWTLILGLGALLCYVYSYERALLLASAIGATISALLHLAVGVFLFVKRKRMKAERHEQRKIDQSELEKKIHEAQNPRGAAAASVQPSNAPAIAGF